MNWRVMRGPLILLLALLVALPSAPSGAEGALAEVELLGSSAFLSAGSIYVVGEVRNTGAAPVTLVRAVATFRDAGNAVIGSAYSFALHDIL
ncbi:MAG TPA: FxLYD domain-containing protein, partial [Anaerolineae bacterium]|nr:FxLYD domain-containing protein [Anaerolineae bacterium]